MVCSLVRLDVCFGTVFFWYVKIILGSVKKAEWQPYGKKHAVLG